MDQKGTRYDEDLATLERLGILLPGAVVVADNVLKPGSPLFLWRLTNSGAYDTHIVRVPEFAMPSDDWMSCSVLRNPSLLNPGPGVGDGRSPYELRKPPQPLPESSASEEEPADNSSTAESSNGMATDGAASSGPPKYPEPPAELVQLQWESDRMRAQAMRQGHGVKFEEWSSFAEQMRARMEPHGIAATIDGLDLTDKDELVPRSPEHRPPPPPSGWNWAAEARAQAQEADARSHGESHAQELRAAEGVTGPVFTTAGC